MDQEYLQNISASPYVEEGAFDRTLARGMAGAQRFSAMTGGGISDLNYTKLQSLFKTFENRVSNILKDFNEIAPRIETMRPPPTPDQMEVIKKLGDVYGILSPTLFQKNQYGQMSPRNISRGSSSLTEIVEGFFNRDLALNSALQSNNPTQILNAYVKQIKKAYDDFLRDSVHVTNTAKDYIFRVIGSIDPKYGKILGAIKSISESPLKSEPGAVPPVIPQLTSANAPAQGIPPVIPGTSPTNNTSSPETNVPPQIPGSALNNAPNLGGAGNEFAIIVGHVIKSIIAAVKEDTARSTPYFTQKLPKTWEDPSMNAKPVKKGDAANSVTEADEEDSEDDPSTDNSIPSTDFEDEPGQFLYNFAGRYDKAKHMAIYVPVSKEPLTLSKGKQRNIRILWVNNQHENNIHVKYQTPSEAHGDNANVWKDILLMKFYDSSADPRSKTFAGKSSIFKYIHDANPYENNLLKNASPSVLKDLEGMTEEFNRALYAIVHRKAMEFKGRPKGYLDLVIGDDKSVTVHNNPNYKNNPYDEEKIKDFLNSTDIKEKELWNKSLSHAGYFEKFPDMKPVVSQNIEDAVTILLANKIGKEESETLVYKAIEKLGDKSKGMTGQQLADYVQTKGASLNNQPAVSSPSGDSNHLAHMWSIPAAVDAVEGLEKLGYKRAVATAFITKVVELKGDNLSSEDYIKLVLKSTSHGKPKGLPVEPITPPVSAPVSAPATDPTPTSPVSKPVSKPAGGPAPASPVSNGDKEEKASGKKRENGKVTFDDNGTVHWTKPDGIVRKFSKAQLNATASNRLSAALKAAGYPFGKFGVKLNESKDSLINPFQFENFL